MNSPIPMTTAKTLLLASWFALQPTHVFAATLEFVGGDATYIQGNANVTTNFGSASEVLVELDTVNVGDGSGIFRGLHSFPTLFGSGANQVPIGASIQSATLRLQTNNPSFNTMGAYMVRVPWSEQTVTWQSFNNGGVANVDFDSTPSATFSAPGTLPPGPVALLDVTSSVSAWSAGRQNFGLLFINAQDDQWTFFSDEYNVLADRPKLTVIYQPIPVPASLALLASGLALIAALFGARRSGWQKAIRSCRLTS